MMRIYTPSRGPSSWRELLADPELFWKRTKSAMELAISWELGAQTPRGVPDTVARALAAHEATRDATLLFGFPEHRVALPGGSRASHTDFWAVLRAGDGWISMAVEGKAGETFGPSLEKWLDDASEGKRARLASLCETLGLEQVGASPLRYQLFHRAASAVLEASRIGASTAVMLVQNFSPDGEGWSDFRDFVTLFGAQASRGGVSEAKCPTVERLLFAWVDSPLATDAGLIAVGEPLAPMV